jgi:hypothetical protein
MESSPATETRVERRPALSGSPRTYGGPLLPPKTAEEADALLSRVERLLLKSQATRDWIPELTRFLGANSQAWTAANRSRLRHILASGDDGGVLNAVISTIRRVPRTDVLDEAELVLRALPSDHLTRLSGLVGESGLEPAVRACLLRAVARSGRGPAEIVVASLNDPEPEVRESAATLVGELRLARGREWLMQRLSREPSELVQAAIREAIASLDA